MNKIETNLFYDESFVDYFVKSMIIDLSYKSLTIETDGGWTTLDDSGGYLKYAKIVIYNWADIKINLFNHNLKIFEPVPISNERALDKIIEFHNNDDTIRLIGFGVNGGWLEWVISDAKLDIFGEYEEINN